MRFHEFFQANFSKFTPISVSGDEFYTQILSNCCRYKYDLSISRVLLNLIFGEFLKFCPTLRQPVVSRLVRSGSRAHCVEQFLLAIAALICSTRRHFYYVKVGRLRLLGRRRCYRRQTALGWYSCTCSSPGSSNDYLVKKLFVKSQWEKLLIFVIWQYEPHYFLSILTFETQCKKWEEFYFIKKRDHWIIGLQSRILWPAYQMV